MYKDRSPTVSFHALQSLWYQVAWMVILAVGWTVTGLLTMIIIGFNVWSILVATVGAVILLFIYRLFAGQRPRGVDVVPRAYSGAEDLRSRYKSRNGSYAHLG